ncbi:alcohol dehydrogenase protein [Lipomyces starkeyi]
MRALCVTESRNLQLRDVPAPSTPLPGYVTVSITAAAINHGDKIFLKRPASASLTSGPRLENVWGASGAGTVTQVGANVPHTYLGRKVAIYRGLQQDAPFLGLWCQTAQVPYQACLLLPDHVDARDYSGSLVNAVTAYAFLEQAAAEGHRGVIVTAGGSATGRSLAVLARRRGMPILVIVRSAIAKEEVLRSGVEMEHVLDSSEPDFMRNLEQTAREIGATAVFDGVGGAFISQMIEALPPRSSVFFYGFLSGAEKVAFHPAIVMMKDLTMRRFSNFESVTVKDEERRADMLKDLEGCIEDPLFRTCVGRDFELEEFEAAMEYEAAGGRKAVFVLSK